MTALTESGVIPSEPVSVIMDPYGNPVLFLRQKRTPIAPFLHRAMMQFTGYYRPTRRTGYGEKSVGVFAQGNAVSGGSYVDGARVPHLRTGPEPIDEPEVSSAEAEASPETNETEQEEEQQQHIPEERRYHKQDEDHRHHEEGHRLAEEDDDDHQQDHHRTNGHRNEEENPNMHHHIEHSQEGEQNTEVTTKSSTEVLHPAKRVPVEEKGTKTKRPVDVDEEEDDYDEEEDEEIAPFVPTKGGKRRYPSFNNFFPMVFRFPGVSTRSGSSGSVPGSVTAIANSYSTGKGGVASSVATAYGGSPNGKKRRNQSSEE
ncbi:uncharacterized protein [Prorops nasuta]